MSICWEDIIGYEGLYQVNTQGQVRNCKGRVLSPNRLTHGYLTVHLYKEGVRKIKCVHRLVAQAFVEGEGPQVNHKNFDRSDNRIENLEWVTPVQNVQHTIKHGRKSITEKPVVGVRISDGRIISFRSQVVAEEYFRGKRTGVVSHCIYGNCASAYGYKWRVI